MKIFIISKRCSFYAKSFSLISTALRVRVRGVYHTSLIATWYDMQEYVPISDSVNQLPRSLIALKPSKPAESTATYQAAQKRRP